ncbi:MauE/DoxX family redox-associated membrane protein [Flavobacterium sp. LM4]|uniref:MauE/DoxX family redox-associated membrane protein n=1 Tax=Flavobacterium sp. LM4 TaxID=1938609 RepID=UPI0009922C82|nr:MauE/DoxX family redox-associated membrane protein [Flavobacterium sp. LM4]OOV20516.1 hypothetical protein BXU10_13260 [Flavobacterium sp. LM4]
MKVNNQFKKVVLELICLLYIMLFVYAAVSKLLDFENFQVQVGQSPMLRSYVPLISYGVPILELILAVLLLFHKTRLVGLYGAFALMSLFSTYLFILLTYSDYIPCSCGGILQKMGWKEHLLFNLVFLVFAVLAIRLYIVRQNISMPLQLKLLSFLFFICSGLVLFQYITTNREDVAVQQFIRHYPHHPILLEKQIDLKYNSYYIAGFQDGKIYLGNVTAPLSVMVVDVHTYKKENYVIQLPKSNLKFRSLRLVVAAPYFYFYDGITAVVFRGKTSDWEASQWLYKAAYFTHMVAVDSTSIAIKALSSTSFENILGLITTKDSVRVSLYSTILERQKDGVFDTDGLLLYNASADQLVYPYFYRNEFLVIASNFERHSKFKTIDQTAIAQVKPVTLSKQKRTVLAEQPLTVNKNSATFGSFIFIQSGIIGNYEPKDNWDSASIIDVYSISSGHYFFSFYLPHQNQHPMSSFSIENGRLAAVSGPYLSLYTLQSPF